MATLISKFYITVQPRLNQCKVSEDIVNMVEPATTQCKVIEKQIAWLCQHSSTTVKPVKTKLMST